MKKFNFGFIVLCPERNIGGLKTTISSIKNYYPKSPYLCVVPEDTTNEEIEEFSETCSVYKAKNSITSLINLGLKKSETDINLIVIAGSWINGFTHRKYEYFYENQKDIMFPVVNGQWNFVDASINGLLINKEAMREVGDFAEVNRLDICKLMWGLDAVDKGYRFKALCGVKIL